MRRSREAYSSDAGASHEYVTRKRRKVERLMNNQHAKVERLMNMQHKKSVS